MPWHGCERKEGRQGIHGARSSCDSMQGGVGAASSGGPLQELDAGRQSGCRGGWPAHAPPGPGQQSQGAITLIAWPPCARSCQLDSSCDLTACTLLAIQCGAPTFTSIRTHPRHPRHSWQQRSHDRRVNALLTPAKHGNTTLYPTHCKPAETVGPALRWRQGHAGHEHTGQRQRRAQARALHAAAGAPGVRQGTHPAAVPWGVSAQR